MHEVLVPVVDDHDQRWVVDFLAQEHERDPLVVHLLSVQPATAATCACSSTRR